VIGSRSDVLTIRGTPILEAVQRLVVVTEVVMAVLWFVHAEAMYGFPVYQFAVSDLIRKFGGAASFKFLCRLDQAPERARAHDRVTIVCCSGWVLAKQTPCDGGLGFMKFSIAAKTYLISWASQTFPPRMPGSNATREIR
jgi:hypothetical protein